MKQPHSTIHPLTKIICTLGPTSHTEAQVMALVRGGMNVARINLSHGSWEQHRDAIRMLHRINKRLAQEPKGPPCVAIMLDTKGAEVRTGDVKKPLEVEEGDEVVFSFKPRPKEKRPVILVNHRHFGKDARDAESILIDNGKMAFALVSVAHDGAVTARALDSGMIGSRRHVNLPGANLDMPSLTDQDWTDLENAAKEGVDFLALSFVRKAEEVEEVRAFLKRKKLFTPLIAKVETRQAVRNMIEIIEASDGVMVARGDLGAEVPFERIPVIQDELVSHSRTAGKPVIVATHMLESMIHDPMPTRAEVTDIAHAATIGTDVTMLSGETASGKYPLKALDAMVRVLRETEDHLGKARRWEPVTVRNEREAQAEAAVRLAASTNASALVVMTRTGQSVRDVSRFRPRQPIIAFAPDEKTQRSLQMLYGVIPLIVRFNDNDPEETVLQALRLAKKRGYLRANQECVLVTDTRAHKKRVSTVQVRNVP